MGMKGQSALEYLVTYGWAILAIVIIAVLLFYFGIFNPSTWVSSENRMTGMSGFSATDIKITTTTIQVQLANEKGNRVNVTNFTYKGTGSLQLANATGGITIGPGSSAQVNITGVSPGQVGDAVNGEQVALTYRDMATGISHTLTGSLSGKVEAG
ncbi:MAG: hypothetical protein AB1468_05615 [Candidatus Micrarchaeota archaeon]